VQIAHDQIARPDHEAAHGHRNADVHQMDISVGNTHATREEVKPRFFHLGHIANGAIGHRAHATEGLVDVGIDLTPEGPEHRTIDVVITTTRGSGILRISFHQSGAARGAPRRLGRDHRGDGIADHGAQVRIHALDVGKHESLVPRTNVE